MPNVMGREFPYTPEGMAAADNYRRAMGMRGGGMMGFRPLGYKDGAEVRNPESKEWWETEIIPGIPLLSRSPQSYGEAFVAITDALKKGLGVLPTANLSQLLKGLKTVSPMVEGGFGDSRISDADAAALGRIAAPLMAGRPLGARFAGSEYGDPQISNADIEQYRRLAPQAGSQYGDSRISDADAAALAEIAESEGVPAEFLNPPPKWYVDDVQKMLSDQRYSDLMGLADIVHAEERRKVPGPEMTAEDFDAAMRFPVERRNRGGLMSLRRR
jgi:hypothetical protein